MPWTAGLISLGHLGPQHSYLSGLRSPVIKQMPCETRKSRPLSALHTSKSHKSHFPYAYAPIPKDGDLRYLVLDPGKHEEPLIGSLIVAHIDSMPKFDTISYVWGKPKIVDQIICDGSFIGITASLRDGLRRVRLPNASRNLWTDQVCTYSHQTAIKTPQKLEVGNLDFLRGVINVSNREMCNPRFEREIHEYIYLASPPSRCLACSSSFHNHVSLF